MIIYKILLDEPDSKKVLKELNEAIKDLEKYGKDGGMDRFMACGNILRKIESIRGTLQKNLVD